jgi:5,10-methylenetetrahydromethanopterin reductase
MSGAAPRVGLALYPTQPINDMVKAAKVAENHNFSTLWIGDSQNIWRESFTAMGAIAHSTSRIGIATGVSNVVTRHLATVAGGFASLQEMAPGRVIAGLGTGDSSLATIGRAPMRTNDLERAVGMLRSLTSGNDVSLDSTSSQVRITYASVDTAVPVYVAASGPKMLDLAGRVADGVVLLAGADPGAIRKALTQVASGEVTAGRQAGTVHRVLWLPIAVEDDSSQARRLVRPHVARTALRPHPVALPAALVQEVSELRRRYDYYQHMSTSAGHAEHVSAELTARFAIAGDPSEVLAQLRELCTLPIDEIALVPFAADENSRVSTAVRCLELVDALVA